MNEFSAITEEMNLEKKNQRIFYNNYKYIF